jgi:MFS family permease
MDRRLLILALSAAGAAATMGGWLSDALWPVMAAAFVAGGLANSLYSLLIAHTNDYLAREDMPSASGALVFIYGLGAISGPLIAGAAMERAGNAAFWPVTGALFLLVTLYAAWRMTRRAGVPAAETAPFVSVPQASTPVAVGAAQEAAQDLAELQAEEGAQDAPPPDQAASKSSTSFSEVGRD